MCPVITVSGQPGSGTTTVASALADTLDSTYVNGGAVFRAMADEHDMSLDEFSKHVNETPSIDQEIDSELRRIVEVFTDSDGDSSTTDAQSSLGISFDCDAEYLILESRLAGWIAGVDATFRVWCHAPLSVRISRINETASRDETREAVVERQNDEAMRYDSWYDIDIEDLSIYDLSINTARWEPRVITELLTDAVTNYDVVGDEGAVQRENPFTNVTAGE